MFEGLSILFVCLKQERSSWGSCLELGSQTGWGATTAGMCGIPKFGLNGIHPIYVYKVCKSLLAETGREWQRWKASGLPEKLLLHVLHLRLFFLKSDLCHSLEWVVLIFIHYTSYVKQSLTMICLLHVLCTEKGKRIFF